MEEDISFGRYMVFRMEEENIHQHIQLGADQYPFSSSSVKEASCREQMWTCETYYKVGLNESRKINERSPLFKTKR